jgi:hypothetical protein
LDGREDYRFSFRTINIAGGLDMNCMNQWVAVGCLAVAPFVAGCEHQAAHAEHEHPAKVEHIDGSEISKVTITEPAMKRLDIRTGTVTEEKSPRSEKPQRAVPYSSLIYDPQGKTWIYTSPQERVFVREEVEVDYIQGDLVYLAKGPEVGTNVATVGVAELYGTEFAVGH